MKLKAAQQAARSIGSATFGVCAQDAGKGENTRKTETWEHRTNAEEKNAAPIRQGKGAAIPFKGRSERSLYGSFHLNGKAAELQDDSDLNEGRKVDEQRSGDP